MPEQIRFIPEMQDWLKIEKPNQTMPWYISILNGKRRKITGSQVFTPILSTPPPKIMKIKMRTSELDEEHVRSTTADMVVSDGKPRTFPKDKSKAELPIPTACIHRDAEDLARTVRLGNDQRT